MKLKEKILNYLRNEYKLIDELSVDEYIMKRKDSILQNHIDNVYPIKTPGEGWKDQRYYWTKLTPQCRGYEHKIYSKTQEELETKIVAYYLNILDDRKLTLENLDANWEKQKNTQNTVFISILSDFNRARDRTKDQTMDETDLWCCCAGMYSGSLYHWHGHL